MLTKRTNIERKGGGEKGPKKGGGGGRERGKTDTKIKVFKITPERKVGKRERAPWLRIRKRKHGKKKNKNRTEKTEPICERLGSAGG